MNKIEKILTCLGIFIWLDGYSMATQESEVDAPVSKPVSIALQEPSAAISLPARGEKPALPRYLGRFSFCGWPAVEESSKPDAPK